MGSEARGRDGATARDASAAGARRGLAAACALVALLACTACAERARPWDSSDPDAGPPGPRPVGVPGAGLAPGGDGGSLLGDAATLLRTADDAGPPPPPVRVGGPWVRCYGNFRPGDDPVRDVTRLGILCGPQNGMTRVDGPALEGLAVEGSPVAAGTVQAARGECLRVFAVADARVTDLDVVVRSSRGVVVGADHSEDRFPIVQPDRPLCFLDDDEVTIEVSSRGQGRFAAEVWRLRVEAPVVAAPKSPTSEPPASSGGPQGPATRTPVGGPDRGP